MRVDIKRTLSRTLITTVGEHPAWASPESNRWLRVHCLHEISTLDLV
jgi:hypothetical protein